MTSFRGVLQLLQSIFVLGTTAYYLFCKPNTPPAASYLNITSHLSEHLFLGHPEVELQVPQILTERKKEVISRTWKDNSTLLQKEKKDLLGDPAEKLWLESITHSPASHYEQDCSVRPAVASPT